MLGRVLLVLAVLLSASFAGCIGKKPDDVKPQNTTKAGLLPNETVAPDGRGQISAFNETNKTETKGIGAMVHQHDFWKGKERLDNVAWINSGLIPFPLTPCKKSDNSCTAGTSNPGGADTYPAGTAIADYDLKAVPEMGMVYEGTKTVEVKLVKLETSGAQGQAVPPNPTGHVFFDYLASNDEPGHFRTGGELKLNEPFKIEIKPTDADMPHQTKSLWIFRIYSDTQMVSFNFNITVSLVKGYDVVNWPPHPNLYADKNARVVYEGPVSLASKGSADGVLFGSDAGWQDPQKVISWGTDRVEIAITNVKYSSDPSGLPDPKGYVLQYRNASTPFLMANGNAFGAEMTDPAGSPASGFHFTIDLTKDDGRALDTPYGQFSRWGFRLYPHFDQTGTGKCVDQGVYDGFLWGCQWNAWKMTYDLKVTAIGHSTAMGVPAGA